MINIRLRLAILTLAGLSCLQAQSWISIGNHETEYARYYLGISSPSVSRNDAINDALSLAIEKAGIENSDINSESVHQLNSQTQTTKNIHNGDISLTGESINRSSRESSRQSSANISNVHLMEEYYDGEVGYVLIRIPKPGFELFDFQSLNENFNRKRKLGGFVRSILVPGWGQYYQQKKIRGSLLSLGFFGSAAAILSSANGYNTSIKNMNNSLLAVDKNRFYDDSQDYKTLYYTGIGAASSFYLWSLLDTQFFPGEWQDFYYKKNVSPRKIRNQNKYYQALTLTQGLNIPTQVEINNSIGDTENFPTMNSNTITLELYKWAGITYTYTPAVYFSSYQTPSNSLSVSEWGIALQYPTSSWSILGLYPSMYIGLGMMNVKQDWAGKNDLIDTYDLGYGFSNKDIDNSKFTYKIESGLHRWFGIIDIFFHLGYQSNLTFKEYEVLAYDGGTNENGGKTTDLIKIPSESLPYPSIDVGGLYFSFGLSYGLEP